MHAAWLEFCRRVSADVETALDDLPTRDDREPVVGRGEGGDDTTIMDDRAERAAVAQLEALHAGGIDFRLVSEELGERTFGAGGPWVVVVDPIDGSLNAKRRLPFYCLSIAFADGPTIADVRFGYVRDFGSGEEWVAEAGAGASVNGRPLGGVRPKDRLGIVDFEATNAALVADGRRAASTAASAASACSGRSRWRCASSPTAASTGWRRSSRRGRSTSPRPG